MNRTPLHPQIKASVLLEAVPWLRTYKGATMVIKYGGRTDALVCGSRGVRFMSCSPR